MITVTESIAIDRPQADVFAYLGDPRNRVEWDSSVISEELTSPEPIEAGSTLRTRMLAVGREVTFEWRIERFVPPTGLTVASTSGPMETTLRIEITCMDAACTVAATIEAEPSGLMRLVEPMIADAVRRNLGGGLARVKGILERHSGAL